MISYAGVPLAFLDTPAALAAAEALETADLLDFAELCWASPPLAFGGLSLARPVRVGSLWWPWGAARFAYAHLLATDGELAKIRPLVYGAAGTQFNAQPLKLDDARTGRGISTKLWMLPPKPLDQIAGFAGLYLLRLVDDRFYWWEKSAQITVTGGTTTWAQLLASVASALGITLTADTISANYLKPPGDLTGYYDTLPLLLDAALRSVGQRFVRKLDGTCLTQNPLTAKKSQDTQLASWTKQKGGQFLFALPAKGSDLMGLAPAQVVLEAPRQDSGIPSATTYTQTVTLASLALPEFAGCAGHAGTKTLATACVAYYVSSALQNGTELTALARQIATDWYRWRLGRQFVRFVGTDPYTPEALNDHVEWLSRGGECSTWVRRGMYGEWLEGVTYQGWVWGKEAPLGNSSSTYGSMVKCCDDWVISTVTGTVTNYYVDLVTFDHIIVGPPKVITTTQVIINTNTSQNVDVLLIQSPSNVKLLEMLTTTGGQLFIGINTAAVTNVSLTVATTATNQTNLNLVTFTGQTADVFVIQTGANAKLLEVITNDGGEVYVGINQTVNNNFTVATTTTTTTPGGFLITTVNNPGQPAFKIVVTGTATTNVFVVGSLVIDQHFKLILTASTTTAASLNIPDGVKPTTPAEGDVYNNGTDLFGFVGGTEYNLTHPAGAAGAPQWVKIVKQYSDFTGLGAVTTGSINVYTLPAGAVIHDGYLHVDTLFAAPSLTSGQISVEYSGGGAGYVVGSAQCVTAGSDASTAFGAYNGTGSSSATHSLIFDKAATKQITMTLSLTGATIDTLTAGKVTANLLVSTPLW